MPVAEPCKLVMVSIFRRGIVLYHFIIAGGFPYHIAIVVEFVSPLIDDAGDGAEWRELCVAQVYGFGA